MKIESQNISLFPSAISSTQDQITINDYFKGIIEGRWQDFVLKYRSGKLEKQQVPAVMASGLFSGRKDKDLSEHSGLLVIDIDEKDQPRDMKAILDQLKEVPEIFAIHYSLGGKGLAVYFRINKAKHFESFEAITKMLVNDYQVIPDMHCVNIGRLRFVSYDPDCHLNFGATVWTQIEKKEQRVNEFQYDNHIFSGDDIGYIINQIKERAINIAPDYYSWLRIGFGLASKLGDSGRDYFKIISSFYYGKQKVSPGTQYDRCLKSNNSGITIKSFFYYAKLAGCNLVSPRTDKIKVVAKIRRKQENSSASGSMKNGKEDARKYLEEFEGVAGSDVDEILKQIWDLPMSEINKEDKDSLLTDIEIFLKSNYQLRLNDITKVVEVDGYPLEDYLFNSIYLKSARVVSEKVNKDRIKDLIHSDFTPCYNPIHEWFEKNKHLRTTGNIKKLCSCINSDISKVDAEFIEYFVEKWLISIVASAHGIYSILCLVLTGQEHGTGKTNFFRELLPESLRWLFAQNKLDGKEADVAKLMCSKWLILDDEFGGKSKIDEKKFKELISTEVFSVRMPYGHYFQDMRRLAVLCGTSNDERIINDLTGNRRILPIQINSIDEKKYAEIDKTELFVELYWKFRDNQKGWFLTKSDIERLNDICYESVQVTPEVELPFKYFEPGKSTDFNAKFVSSSEIRSVIEKISGIRLSQQKLSISLKNLKFEKDVKYINTIKCKGFWVIEKYNLNPESVQPVPLENKIEQLKKASDELPF
jgi:predicted P-loop ATPase